MVDTKPLLKGFGAAADVIGQIATDKAVNSRRQTPTSFDITRGQLVQAGNLASGDNTVPHSLGVIPNGAVVINASGSSFSTQCTGATISDVTIYASAAVENAVILVL